MTDCMRSGLSPRASAMVGSAVLTMVPSSVCMKKPMATSHRSTEREEDVVEAEALLSSGIMARQGGRRR